MNYKEIFINNKKTFIWYLITILTTVWAKTNCKSGPCTPNLDILLPPLFLLISFFLIMKTLFSTVMKKEENVNLILIHLFGCLILIFFYTTT
jgi:hypothetical protein